MHARYPRIINLGQELSYVLVSGPSIVSSKPSEIWHSKPVRIRQSIKVIWIRFLVRPCPPFGCKPKLSQGPGNLFPNTVSHSPADIVHCPRCIRCWCPREEHIRCRSVWYSTTHQRDIRPVSHGLVEWLLEVWVHLRVRLSHVSENPLVTLARRAPWVRCAR
jgi:hypothetical protein